MSLIPEKGHGLITCKKPPSDVWFSHEDAPCDQVRYSTAGLPFRFKLGYAMELMGCVADTSLSCSVFFLCTRCTPSNRTASAHHVHTELLSVQQRNARTHSTIQPQQHTTSTASHTNTSHTHHTLPLSLRREREISDEREKRERESGEETERPVKRERERVRERE